MVSPHLFDLVITTTQYAVREADNVVRLPITITNTDAARPDRFEKRWFEGFARPRRLLVIGGKTSLWRFEPSLITASINVLKGHAERDGGSILAVTSPRTSPELLAAAQRGLGEKAVVTGPFPRYGALLSAADEIHVTGDSVSMLSDAVAQESRSASSRWTPIWSPAWSICSQSFDASRCGCAIYKNSGMTCAPGSWSVRSSSPVPGASRFRRWKRR